MTYTVKKTANIISIIMEEDIIVKTWYVCDFTERKLKNAMKKLQKESNQPVLFLVNI